MSVGFRKMGQCGLETELRFGSLGSCMERWWYLAGRSVMAETSPSGCAACRNCEK